MDDDDELELEQGLRHAEHWMSDEEVERTEFDYSDRHPEDWIISGPLISGSPGRVFPTWEDAERWAREKYGARFRGPVLEVLDAVDGTRWAFWVRGRG